MRIYSAAAFGNSKVTMIACRPTGTAAFRNSLTFAYLRTFFHYQRGVMTIQRCDTTAVVDDDRITVTIHPAGICNSTRFCCNNGRAIRCRNIQTIVEFFFTGNGACTITIQN